MVICGRYFFKSVFKMASAASLERIKQNAELAKKTICELKTELQDLNVTYNNVRAQQLREENAQLLKAVEEAKQRLIQLEIQNGIKQVPVPNSALACTATTKPVSENAASKQVTTDASEAEKPKKEKKPKETKAKDGKETKPKDTKEKAAPAAELPVDIGRLDLRIAKVEDVQRHPDADSLYVLKINCGEEKPRTVCSGLVKHVPIEALRDRMVMLLCNLKPVKMRGITSEAMVMCASTPDKVEVLIPPADCQPGDLVDCEGYQRQPDAVMNPKKKIFETVAPDLHTNDANEACYKGKCLYVGSKGRVISENLKNSPVK